MNKIRMNALYTIIDYFDGQDNRTRDDTLGELVTRLIRPHHYDDIVVSEDMIRTTVNDKNRHPLVHHFYSVQPNDNCFSVRRAKKQFKKMSFFRQPGTTSQYIMVTYDLKGIKRIRLK